MTETNYRTPQEAEAAFYRAFSARDVTSMMAVWSDADDIVCVHPGGQMLTGNDAIRGSWTAIFSNAPEIQFVVAEQQRSHGERLAVHVVQEHIRSGGQLPRAPIIATNVYRLTDGGWRMVLHHASPGVVADEADDQQKQTLH
ncbi:MAG: nuclear transport factor 2 family protein [Pseudomonadota bacterium]|nr:MAG: nuclear transport factor 2 family protein [Pseudomonadota bacterium]